MSAVSDTAAPVPRERPRPFRWLLAQFGDKMPKGLYARALIIIIAPMVLLQSVVTFVFLERHWQTVTHRLSTGTVQNINETRDRLTIQHDGSPSGQIAAGTNEFIVQNGDQLALIKAGQKIEFSFLKDVEGQLVITAISPTPP